MCPLPPSPRDRSPRLKWLERQPATPVITRAAGLRPVGSGDLPAARRDPAAHKDAPRRGVPAQRQAAARSARGSPGPGVGTAPLGRSPPSLLLFFIRKERGGKKKEKKRKGKKKNRVRESARSPAPQPALRLPLARPPCASHGDTPMARRDTARWAGPERGVGGGSVQQPRRGSATIAEAPLLPQTLASRPPRSQPPLPPARPRRSPDSGLAPASASPVLSPRSPPTLSLPHFLS